MGLVDYSDSESDSESVPATKPTVPTSTASSKKPFQKLVDSANPGKIQVSLPSAATSAFTDEPPAKRARIASGNRFSNFSSFLPPPKAQTVAKPSQLTASALKPTPRPGIHLKTSAEAAFSRESDTEYDGSGILPAPKAPSIPADQMPAEEVKLIGKPLMFKPLSVARKPGKKPGKAAKLSSTPVSKGAPVAPTVVQEVPVKKKVSLFSLGEGDEPADEPPWEEEHDQSRTDDAYAVNAALTAEDDVTGPYDPSVSYQAPPGSSGGGAQSLGSLADDMNLSAAARRELFGRDGRGKGARVINFDTEREYAHNEQVRASGDTVQHNPVRALQPGKHSLRQLVNAVQSQRDALEDSFAKNRATQREAGSKYGWR